jgi:hypothetical protein
MLKTIIDVSKLNIKNVDSKNTLITVKDKYGGTTKDIIVIIEHQNKRYICVWPRIIDNVSYRHMDALLFIKQKYLHEKIHSSKIHLGQYDKINNKITWGATTSDKEKNKNKLLLKKTLLDKNKKKLFLFKRR